jgi:hypothetical protein
MTRPASLEQFPDKACYVSLDIGVGLPVQELSNTTRAKRVCIEKVPFQDFYRFSRVYISEQGANAGRHIFDAFAIIPHDIVQIIGILVFAMLFEREGHRPTLRGLPSHP